MSAWWDYFLLGFAAGCGAFYVVRELALGARDGWNKSGKSFADEVRERVAAKRNAP